MTASKSPNVHEEIAALDEIERELVRLTTADLEERRRGRREAAFTPAPTFPNTFEAVIPANAGIHTECDVPTENEGAVTPPGDGSRRAPGVSQANGLDDGL